MAVRLLLASLLLLAGCGSDDSAQHEKSIPWSLGGQWLIADLHTHTKFSDGGLSPEELATRAAINGCHVLAITDHSDHSVKAASNEYFIALAEIRGKIPQMIVLAGIEWNVPPYNGQEHVNLIVDPQIEQTVLPQFRLKFERNARLATAEVPLKWLASQVKETDQYVLFYNHPLRRSESSPERVEKDLASWHEWNRSFVAFEGAPGHQRSEKLGAYRVPDRLQNRWDLTSAEIGGVWDRLLARGTQVWGALANSDYHNDRWDEEPCGFSQTFLQVPARTAKGVLQALRDGTFWAGHGKLLRHLSFTVHAPGLTVPATAGEVIRYRVDRDITVRVSAERNKSAAERTLTVELIGNCASGRIESLGKAELASAQSDVEFPVRKLAMGADGASCYLRARVNGKGSSGDELFAYTNPVRIRFK